MLLPGKSHGWRSLEGCSPWGRQESDTTERLPFRFSLSCIGEGNGNPLQCSCLENPRDGGAWWASVYGVAQSRTRLKRLSSSSSTPRASLPVYLCRRHQVWESGILDDFYNLGTFTQAARYPQKSDYLSTGQLRRESYRSRAHPLANLSDVLSCLTSPGITLCRIMGKGEQCF